MYTVAKNTPITKELIEKVVEYVEKNKKRYQLLDRYYEGRHTILDRDKVENLANNKIVVNHPKYITNINVAYLLGNPIDYQPDPASKTQPNIDSVKEEYRKQGIEELDHEIATDLSKYGRAYEYVYVDEDNSVLSVRYDPMNCIVVYDNTTKHLKEFAVTYTGCSGTDRNREYENLTVITKEDIIQYDKDLKPIAKVPHVFLDVPVIEYKNNSKYMGDFEDVIDLIDSYNLLQSDRVNDKQQLVEAILMLYGVGLTEPQLAELKKYRVLSAPKDTKAEYLIKQLQEGEISVLRKELEADIHKISMTPNLSDEKFVGNSSGVAIKYKLLAFEQNIQNKEIYLKKGLLNRFTLYNNYLFTLKKMSKVFPYDVKVILKRNLPSNDLETSQVVNNLSGKVSDETLIAQISFVEDAKAEVEKAKKASLEDMQLQAEQFGTNTPNGFNNPTGKPKAKSNNSDKKK